MAKARFKVSAAGCIQRRPDTQMARKFRSYLSRAALTIRLALYPRRLIVTRSGRRVRAAVALSLDNGRGHAHNLIGDPIGFLLKLVAGSADLQLRLYLPGAVVFRTTRTVAAAGASGFALND